MKYPFTKYKYDRLKTNSENESEDINFVIKTTYFSSDNREVEKWIEIVVEGKVYRVRYNGISRNSIFIKNKEISNYNEIVFTEMKNIILQNKFEELLEFEKNRNEFVKRCYERFNDYSFSKLNYFLCIERINDSSICVGYKKIQNNAISSVCLIIEEIRNPSIFNMM